MVTTGGEEGFIERMIEESLVLGEKVRWYTCMLGKLSTLSTIIAKLKELGVTNWAVGRFVQEATGKEVGRRKGGGTRRWAIAWSFGTWRPSKAASIPSPKSTSLRGLTPFPTEYIIQIPLATPSDIRPVISSTLTRLLCDLDFSDFQIYRNTAMAYVANGMSYGNVWSRAARRAKARKTAEGVSPQRTESVTGGGKEKGEKNEFRFRITASIVTLTCEGDREQGAIEDEMETDDEGHDEDHDELEAGPEVTEATTGAHHPKKQAQKSNALRFSGIEIVVCHVRGADTVLFESFCGAVNRWVGSVQGQKR